MKKYVWILFALTLVGVSQRTFAQNVPVRGYVFDEETQKPLTGASVFVKGKNTGTVTNLDGFFELKTALPTTLIVTLVGYIRTEATVKSPNDVRVNLKSSIEQGFLIKPIVES